VQDLKAALADKLGTQKSSGGEKKNLSDKVKVEYEA